MSDFAVTTLVTTVAEAHSAPFPDPVTRAVWFVEPTDTAIVLGSTQALTVLEMGEVARRRLGIVRRHSGGGAVLVDAASSTWFDVWIPADDPHHCADVSRSAQWLGEAIAQALRTTGIADVEVVEPSATLPASSVRSRDRWAHLVCFAGQSGGEVLVGGRKVVGISQRRTRSGARFQVTVLHRFEPEELASLFAVGAPERSELVARLRAGVSAVDVDRGELRSALVDALSSR